MDMHFVYGFATVMSLLLLKDIGNDILDLESLIGVCSHVFTDTCEKSALFGVETAVLNVKCNGMWRKRRMILMWYSEVQALGQKEFKLSHSFNHESLESVTYRGTVSVMFNASQHLECVDIVSRLEFCQWIHSNPQIIRNISCMC
jgi:hypothetical protein